MLSTRTIVGGLFIISFVLCSAAALPASVNEISGPRKGQAWSLPLSANISLDMVWIAPGNFTMGSGASEPMSAADERPQTHVALTRGYWLGKTIFTIGQWTSVIGLDVRGQLNQLIHDDTLYDLGGKKQTVREYMGFSTDADPGKYLAGEQADLPMYFVSWNDAMALCKKLNERERAAGRLPAGYEYNLPSEAQYEYACRAGTTEATYGGAMIDEGHAAAVLDPIAWYNGNSYEGYVGKGFNVSGHTGGPRAVAQKLPNAWGLYDMLGDVWQWCRDWYGPLPGGSVTDPTGAATGTDRVNRGGSFGSGAGSERSASRAQNPPAEASAYRGFRVALCPIQ